MSRNIKLILAVVAAIAVLCVGMSGCTNNKSTEQTSDTTTIIDNSTSELISTSSSSETTSSQSLSSSISTSSTKQTNNNAKSSSTKTASTNSASSSLSIKTDNPYGANYGAINQQQYDVISKGAKKTIAEYSDYAKSLRSEYTAESYQSLYHVDINNEVALKVLFAYSNAAGLSKNIMDDGLNAYNVFVNITSDFEKYHGSSARAAEAICHKLGVNCKIADCPKANLQWIYVQLEDGKWYHFNVFSGIGFVTDAEQIVKYGSTCKIFY